MADYAAHFPVVEVDTSFYAIPSPRTTANWAAQTPDEFRFVIKAFSAMTKHKEWSQYFDSENAMYTAYMDMIAPISETGKLQAILFQFPPYFNCTKENVIYLKYIASKMVIYRWRLNFAIILGITSKTPRKHWSCCEN